ncbi:hypothetical protein [Sneathiella chinensis]|nr:hypothetical protein [Sneathiella chinensis]
MADFPNNRQWRLFSSLRKSRHLRGKALALASGFDTLNGKKERK